MFIAVGDPARPADIVVIDPWQNNPRADIAIRFNFPFLMPDEQGQPVINERAREVTPDGRDYLARGYELVDVEALSNREMLLGAYMNTMFEPVAPQHFQGAVGMYDQFHTPQQQDADSQQQDTGAQQQQYADSDMELDDAPQHQDRYEDTGAGERQDTDIVMEYDADGDVQFGGLRGGSPDHGWTRWRPSGPSAARLPCPRRATAAPHPCRPTPTPLPRRPPAARARTVGQMWSCLFPTRSPPRPPPRPATPSTATAASGSTTAPNSSPTAGRASATTSSITPPAPSSVATTVGSAGSPTSTPSPTHNTTSTPTPPLTPLSGTPPDSAWSPPHPDDPRPTSPEPCRARRHVGRHIRCPHAGGDSARGGAR
ncbi:hypothetical protein NKH18_50465 [Streptomyces sp. M10(2022)]